VIKDDIHKKVQECDATAATTELQMPATKKIKK
jgi:hypothetical protein